MLTRTPAIGRLNRAGWLVLLAGVAHVLALAARPSGATSASRDFGAGCLDLLGEGIALNTREERAHPYNAINKQLCKRLKSDSAQENLGLLLKWNATFKGKRLFLLRAVKMRALALRQLTLTARLKLEGRFCSDEATEANLRQVAREVSAHVRELRQEQPGGLLMCNRVFEVYFAQTLDHLESCPQTYVAQLAERRPRAASLNILADSFALLIDTLELEFDEPEWNLNFVQKLLKLLSDDWTGQHQGERLIELAASSLARLMSIKTAPPAESARERSFELLNELAFKPCFHLANMARAPLGAATLDLELLASHWRDGARLPSARAALSSYPPRFYALWANYLLCDRLLELDYARLAARLAQKLTGDGAR